MKLSNPKLLQKQLDKMRNLEKSMSNNDIQLEISRINDLGKKTKGKYRTAFMNIVKYEKKQKKAKLDESMLIKNSGVRYLNDERKYKLATNPALIDTREEIEYVKKLKDTISINKDRSMFIGSATYKVQKYPSDFDVFEMTDFNSSLVSNLQKVCNRFNNGKFTVFLELKAGYDIDYDINSIDIDNYRTTIKNFTAYYLKGYISQDEYETIKKELKYGDKCKEVNLFAALRNYLILRWNIDEVNKGYKILTNGKRLNLVDALKLHTDVNIECAFIDLDGSIQDISNFYFLVKDGKSVSTERNMVDSLKRSTFILSNSCFRKVNIFKAIKRMYSLARLICLNNPVASVEYQKYSKYLNKITLAIESDLNILYYAYSKLKATLEIYEKLHEDTPNENNFFPSDYKNTVSDVLHDIHTHLSHDKEAYPILIDASLELINYVDGTGDLKKLEDDLDKLLSILNERSLMFLYNEGLAQQSNKYTPIIDDFTKFNVDDIKTYIGNPYLPYIFNSKGPVKVNSKDKEYIYQSGHKNIVDKGPVFISDDYIGDYEYRDPAAEVLKYANQRSIDKYFNENYVDMADYYKLPIDYRNVLKKEGKKAKVRFDMDEDDDYYIS